jgi:hypothetical protein
MKCPECGSLASDEDLFCGECGAILAPSLPDEPVDVPAFDWPDEPAAPPPLDLPLELVPPVPPPSTPASSPAARDSRANIAFILGVVSVGSIVASCIPLLGSLIGCLGPVAGIVAIVLGAVVKRDIKARGGLQEDWKRAHQGMILGIAGIVIYGVLLVIGVLFGVGAGLLGEL